MLMSIHDITCSCNCETYDENSLLTDTDFAVFNIQTFRSLEELINWAQKVLVYNIMNKTPLFDGND